MFGFTTTSKYDAAVNKIYELRRACNAAVSTADTYQMKYRSLLDEYNNLVNRINKHGGESLFDKVQAPTEQFTAAEINTLISLCHPDKHSGKDSANRMTTKLLQLRK